MKPTLATPPAMNNLFASSSSSHRPDLIPPLCRMSMCKPSRTDSTISHPSSTGLDKITTSVLTSPRITSTLSLFISDLIHSTWHSTTNPPPASFSHFTSSILKTANLPFSVVLFALLLIDRLKKRRPALRGSEGSECRLLVCALMVAMKVLLDNTYTNRTWEKVSRIPVKELNIMEMEFLSQLNFDIHVTDDEYFLWLQHIESAVRDFRHPHYEQITAPSSPSPYYTPRSAHQAQWTSATVSREPRSRSSSHTKQHSRWYKPFLV
ncbi:hypothetical protein SpCBS45565_g07067 [Spizellomyces sp. 'palustris']|nr:hypothetical protein SpCBS45565_g07067 [Spizellomyces sp. 'palustris']